MGEFVTAHPVLAATLFLALLSFNSVVLVWLLRRFFKRLDIKFDLLFAKIDTNTTDIAENKAKIAGVEGAHDLAMQLNSCPMEKAAAILDKCPLLIAGVIE